MNKTRAIPTPSQAITRLAASQEPAKILTNGPTTMRTVL